MTTPATDILGELRKLNVRIWVRDGDLHVQPINRVTEPMIEQIRKHKAGIVQILRSVDRLEQSTLESMADQFVALYRSVSYTLSIVDGKIVVDPHAGASETDDPALKRVFDELLRVLLRATTMQTSAKQCDAKQSDAKTDTHVP